METEKLPYPLQYPVHRMIYTRPPLSIEEHRRAIERTPTPTRFDKNRQQRLLQLKLKRNSASIPGVANGSNGAALRSESSQAKDVDDAVGGALLAYKELIGTLEYSKSLPRTSSKEDRLRAVARTPTSKRFDKLFEKRRQERSLKGHFGVSKNIAPIATHRFEEASTDVPLDNHAGAALGLETVDQHPSIDPTDAPETAPTTQETRTIEEIINMARHASQLVTERESRPGNMPSEGACSQARADRDDPPIRSNSRAQQNDSDADADQELDEVDLQILRIGHNSFQSPPVSPANPEVVTSPSSSKRDRFSTNRNLPDLYNLQYEVDNAVEENEAKLYQPLRKKQRRASRINHKANIRGSARRELEDRRGSEQAQELSEAEEPANHGGRSRTKKAQEKRPPRRVPVDELVLVSERLDDFSDPGFNGPTPAELSQDPISQPSDANDTSSGMTREYAKPGKILQIEVRPHPGKGFGNIDISEFRMPTAQNESTRYSAYSDGFEGKEAQPIGRFMPVRRPKQTQSFLHKITLKMGQLTLVAERAFGEEVEEVRVHRCEGRRRRRNPPEYQIAPPDEAMHCEKADEPLTNDLPEQQSIYNLESHGEPDPNTDVQSTPITTSHYPAFDTTRSESSPLKTKNRPKQRVQFNDKLATCQKSSTSVQILPFGRAKSDEQTVSQQMRLVSAQKKTPSKQRKKDEDFKVSQQLMMVTLQRRVAERDDDDDTNSERTDGSYTGSESESVEGLEEDDDKSDSPPEEDSEEDSGEEEAEYDEVRGQELQAEEAMNQLTDNHLERHKKVSNHQDKKGECQPISRSCSNMSNKSTQQPALSDELLFDAGGDQPDQHRLKTDVSIHADFEDDSWRPRKPDQGSVAIEVDEEIYDSPSPVHNRTRSSKELSGDKIQPSGVRCRALTIIRSRRPGPHVGNTHMDQEEGSIEVGGPHGNRRLSIDTIPETQFEEVPQSRESQQTFTPGSSYFERASQQLQEPIRKLDLMRIKSMPIKSMPARFRDNLGENQPGVMAGGMTLSAAFRHTVLPATTNPPPTLLEATQSQERSLRILTRQASIELGTLPGSNKRRMVSLPFTPPFKKQ